MTSEDRLLYGCGMIWAAWIWPSDRSRWSYDLESMARIRDMGGTHTGINLAWIDLEPQPGQWYWDYADHQVAAAERYGLRMFAYMGLTPDWAIPELVARYHSGIGYRFPPPEESAYAFRQYCRKVALRYKGRIRHYQFWNEPNGCSWVNDGCANGHEAPNTRALYTRWLKEWATAMRRVDPNCVLGLGGLDLNQGVERGHEYLEGVYAHGGREAFDAVSIHPYDANGTLHHKAIQEIRRVMVEHGDARKGVWISEYGWAMTDEVEKARRVTQTLQELAEPRYRYVSMANYLSITDPTGEPGFGLCNRDLTPRLSYLAFQKARKVR